MKGTSIAGALGVQNRLAHATVLVIRWSIQDALAEGPKVRGISPNARFIPLIRHGIQKMGYCRFRKASSLKL
jgi:hypothetical protein